MAIVAVAAITLVPTALLANRIVANGAVTVPTDLGAAPTGFIAPAPVTYSASPAPPALAQQPMVDGCGLICDPDMGALWQHVVSASDIGSRSEIVANAIRMTLRAIDEAVVGAAPALR
jgi:hypothetical protein